MEDKIIRKTSSQVMDLQQLIAGPLIATIEADALSALKYLDYLMRIAFESYDPITGETGKLRMLTFTYNEQDVNGSTKMNVSIPLLTLVPLPLLHVEEADFDFNIMILDAQSERVEEKFSVENGDSVKQPQSTDFKMRASLAPLREVKDDLQQSLSANMNIKVRMRQADMPAGLSNLLNLTANNVQVENTRTEEAIDRNTEGGSDGRE